MWNNQPNPNIQILNLRDGEALSLFYIQICFHGEQRGVGAGWKKKEEGDDRHIKSKLLNHTEKYHVAVASRQNPPEFFLYVSNSFTRVFRQPSHFINKQKKFRNIYNTISVAKVGFFDE